MKRSPIRRHPHKDPVTHALRLAVLERDGERCVTTFIEWDQDIDACAGPLTLDHVQEGYGRMGKRAPSRLDTLAVVCAHHHLDGWATSHRPELRAYLALSVPPEGPE